MLRQLRIIGTNLPGSECAGYRGVHVGVQRKREPTKILGLTSADADIAMWTIDCDPHIGLDGTYLRSPYVSGAYSAQFVYLSWNTVDGDEVRMFRRAKLRIDNTSEVFLDAMVKGVLVARLGLTDAKGEPLCASVRPPLVEWSARL